jgi:riboflavin synthase
MFTGIVEEVGRVAAVERFDDGRRIRVVAARVLGDLAVGDSIAVDGVCQTVVARDDQGFVVEAIATTLGRTTLGTLAAGDEVNLERPLAAGARLGGHFVQGHVDAVARVRSIDPHAEHVLLDVEVPDHVAEVTVLHGSIAIQGVSLTVNALPAPGVVQVALIPHTWTHTNLRRLRPGSGVNVEGDLIGRYVVEYLKRRGGTGV